MSSLTSALVVSMANAFNFSTTPPAQCDSLNVTWTGGQAPFQLLITPNYGTPHNFSIPSSAVRNTAGTFSTQLALPQGTKFLLTMSDGTGFGSGGTSQVFTVGSSVTGTNCNTTDPGTAFTFELPDALQQCNPYTFKGYSGAILPITIYGLIPGGQTTIMNPPNGPSYQWITDVAAGTTMMFLMVDSQGRQGGSSDVLTVASSGDSTCLNAQSPTSTANPSASGTSPPVATQTTGSQITVGAIAGTALGALIALAVLVTLGLFFLKKWKGDDHSVHHSGGFGSGRQRSQQLGSTDNILAPQYNRAFDGDQSLNAYRYPSAAAPSPVTPPLSVPPSSSQYELPPFSPPSASSLHSRSASRADSGSPFVDGEQSQAGRQKGTLAGVSAYKQARFILHTDVEEAVPVEEEDVVELPPQYTDRRQPPIASNINRQPSNSINRHPSNNVRRRPSGNVPLQDIPLIPPNLTRSPPSGEF